MKQLITGVIPAGLMYGKSTDINLEFKTPFQKNAQIKSIVLQEATPNLPLIAKVLNYSLNSVSIQVFNLTVVYAGGGTGGNVAQNITVSVAVDGE